MVGTSMCDGGTLNLHDRRINTCTNCKHSVHQISVVRGRRRQGQEAMSNPKVDETLICQDAFRVPVTYVPSAQRSEGGSRWGRLGVQVVHTWIKGVVSLHYSFGIFSSGNNFRCHCQRRLVGPANGPLNAVSISFHTFCSRAVSPPLALSKATMIQWIVERLGRSWLQLRKTLNSSCKLCNDHVTPCSISGA